MNITCTLEYSTSTIYVEDDNGNAVPKTRYTFKFPFDGRDEYFDWRAKWRADYKALSARIRDLKRQRKPRYRRDGWSPHELGKCQDEARLLLAARIASKKRSVQLRDTNRRAA